MAYARLKKQTDFQKLFKSGKRGFSPSLTILTLPSKEMTFGISVGKKHGKSVTRNRVKRLLREVFKNNAHLLQGTYKIVFLPKPKENKDEYTYDVFEKDFKRIVKKEKL